MKKLFIIAATISFFALLYLYSYPYVIRLLGPFPKETLVDRALRASIVPAKKFHEVRFLGEAKGIFVEEDKGVITRKVRISFPSTDEIMISECENILHLKNGTFSFVLESGLISFQPSKDYFFEYVVSFDGSSISLECRPVASNESYSVELFRSLAE